MEKGERSRSDRDGMESVIFPSTQSVIPLSTVLQCIHMVHDCVGAKCTLSETRKVVRMEQEDVEKIILHIKHNLNYPVFFINKFRFTHVKDKYTA